MDCLSNPAKAAMRDGRAFVSNGARAVNTTENATAGGAYIRMSSPEWS